MNSKLLPTQTNSNNTVTNLQNLPDNLVQMMEDIIDTRVNNILWCRVQCISVDIAADCLGLYPDTVRQWIKGGKLNASKCGREYLIRLIDLDKMLTQSAMVIQMPKRKSHKRNAQSA